MRLITNWRSKPGSLSPREARAGREGAYLPRRLQRRQRERVPKRPPLPACVAEATSPQRSHNPLLLVGGAGEATRIRFAQSQVLSKHSSQFESDLEWASPNQRSLSKTDCEYHRSPLRCPCVPPEFSTVRILFIS